MRVLVLIIIGASIFSSASLCKQTQRGKLLEEWQTANTAFKLRVTTYAENAVINPGAYYVFRSAPLDLKIGESS